MKQALRLCLLFYSYSLFGDIDIEGHADSVAGTEGLPSSIINNAICVITGEYHDSHVDLVIPGPEPLIFSRSYSVHNTQGNLGNAWSYNHRGHIHGNDGIFHEENVFYLLIKQPTSAQYTYVHPNANFKNKIQFQLVPSKGMTNGGLGTVSGKYNVKNQVVKFYKESKSIEIVDGAGTKSHFEFRGYNGEDPYSIFSQTFQKNPNLTHYIYEFQPKSTGSPFSRIKCLSPGEKTLFSSIEMIPKSDESDKNRILFLKASHGKELTYKFRQHKFKTTRKAKNAQAGHHHVWYYIDSVEMTHQPSVSYNYSECGLSGQLHLTKKSHPNHRFLETHYFKKGANHLGGSLKAINIEDKDDYRIDRVKCQSAPVGHDRKAIPIYHFDYHIKKRKNPETNRKELAEGHTDVYDAYWHKTSYEFNAEQRLTSIHHFSGTDQYQLRCQENFIWNESKTAQEGFLKGKYTKNSQGMIEHALFYEYDDRGNPTKKTISGNITGYKQNLRLNEKQFLSKNNYEQEVKSYTYSNDGMNLLTSETNSLGVTIRYIYQTNSNVLKAKLVLFNNKIQLREFYRNDENNVTIRTVIDDGHSEDKDDLSGVTHRKMIYSTPTQSAPYGLITRQEECYSDLQRHHHHKKCKVVLTSYTADGKPSRKDILDENEQLCFSLFWEYDAHGNVIKEVNAVGEVIIRQYDENDNLIFQQGPHNGYSLHNTYDYSNRLVRQEEHHLDGHRFVTSHKYNYLGQCISTTDSYGHETKFDYDDFGNVKTIIKPPVPNEQGVLTIPIIKIESDLNGNPISVTDPLGRTLRTEYNIRKKPVKIMYPEGTEERMYYTIEGLLEQKITKDKQKICFKYDIQGRVIQESYFDQSGVRLKEKTMKYDAFHLLSMTDFDGMVTRYEYDLTGKIKASIRGDARVEYGYDGLGRQNKTVEFLNGAPYRMTYKKLDWKDQVIEERVEDVNGTILSSSRFQYDSHGHKIFEQNGDQIIRTENNPLGNPIKITNPLGDETHTIYVYDHVNEFQQRVLKSITTDTLGYQFIQIYDITNRPSETIYKNPFGVLVSHQQIYYDLVGNKARLVDYKVVNGEDIKKIETLCKYRADNQIEKIIEAAGTTDQKITSYQYNLCAQKTAKMKSDGCVILYDYNNWGLLSDLRSGDNRVRYHYDYDVMGRLIDVSDIVNQTHTRRDYDSQGLLVGEHLANGLSVRFDRDIFGRVTHLTLPDDSTVDYVYDPLNIREIHRLKEGQNSYSYKETQHNLRSSPLECILPGNLGSVKYAYDVMNRLMKIDTPVWRQMVAEKGYDKRGNLVKYQRDETDYRFEYNDLCQLSTEQGDVNHDYAYDSLHNRLKKDQEIYATNDLHQLVQRGKEFFVYNRTGQLIERSGDEKRKNTRYEYDAVDRLVSIINEEISIHYEYDGFNRRIVERQSTQKEKKYLYIGMDEVGLYEEGEIKELKILHPLSAQSVAIEIGARSYIPIHDISGSIACIMDMEGTRVEAYRYSAFGEMMILSQQGDVINDSAIGNPWRYSGKRWNKATGLLSFGLRDYDPEIGRWLCPDPAGDVDGSNLYAYVHNCPLIFSDRHGLYIDPDIEWEMDGEYTLGNPRTHCRTRLYTADLDFEKRFEVAPGFENRNFFSRTFSWDCLEKSKACSTNDFINSVTNELYQFVDHPLHCLMYSGGILNKLSDHRNNLFHLSSMTNYNFRSVHAATFGFGWDAGCFLGAKWGHFTYEPTRMLQEEWTKFFDTAAADAKIIMVCHSRGALYVRNALLHFPEELRQRIYVIAVAPAAYIDECYCGGVMHIISLSDIVPLFDPAGLCMNLNKISVHLNKSDDLFDHSFLSPTYEDAIKKNITHFLGE